jgi:hypothetical protein
LEGNVKTQLKKQDIRILTVFVERKIGDSGEFSEHVQRGRGNLLPSLSVTSFSRTLPQAVSYGVYYDGSVAVPNNRHEGITTNL